MRRQINPSLLVSEYKYKYGKGRHFKRWIMAKMDTHGFRIKDLIDLGIPYSSFREWSKNKRKPRTNSIGPLSVAIAKLTNTDKQTIKDEITGLYR